MIKKEINLLLLGASGAGKSSFAKTFLLHSSLIDSTNDGQTTRSNIIYDLSLYEKEPSIEIKFLNKDEFITRMTQLNYSKYLLKIVNILHEKEKFSSLEEYLFSKFSDDQLDEEKKELLKESIFEIDQDIEKNIERYGAICDLVEEKIEAEFGCDGKEQAKDKVNIFIKEEKDSLNETLSKIEGFFDIQEFKYYFNLFRSDTDFLKEDIDVLDEDKKNFSSYFEKYYRELHEKIIKNLKDMDIVKETDYKWKLSLNDKENISEIITYCLQVKDKISLTGLVDYVHIKDSISNDYSFIMDNLKISNLKLFDTYGLDHSNWNGEKGKILSDVLYALQEKKLLTFNSDLAVVYVKKLDSGKPTELKSIIPQIYRMIPQAPVYCVLNGLDIFLGPQINTFSGFDYSSKVQVKPKSIEYLISNSFKDEINKVIGANNQFVDYLYETLKNNIVSFCSNISILENNFNILNHNRKEIYKLLISICMKEYSSMNIIPEEVTKELDNGKYDKNIKEFIKDIFKNASKINWDCTHHMTRKANYTRTAKGVELGYSGTYQHKWNQLFHQGYIKAVTQNKSNFLGVSDSKYAYAVDACIKNMEERFLGLAYQLAYQDIKNREKTKFRELIEEMYKQGKKEGVYKNNPFENEGENISVVESKYLNDVCDFYKGYNLIQEDLLTHFKKNLKEVIYQENKAKSENLLKVNYEFYTQLEKLKYEFERKYTGIKFNDMLKYYSEKNEENLKLTFTEITE